MSVNFLALAFFSGCIQQQCSLNLGRGPVVACSPYSGYILVATSNAIIKLIDGGVPSFIVSWPAHAVIGCKRRCPLNCLEEITGQKEGVILLIIATAATLFHFITILSDV